MGWGGGLSDRVCLDAQFVFKLPEKITSEIGGKTVGKLTEVGVALVEPLAVAWHAVEQSAAKAGDNVLVIGAGPIGLAILQCLKALNTAQVIVAEVAQNRRDLALHFGAAAAIDPTDEDMVSRCKMLCNWGKEIPFNPDYLLVGEKRLVTGKPSRKTIAMIRNLADLFRALSYTSEDFERVIDALDKGTIDAEKMITRTISMDRVVEDGILALLHEKEKHIKILVDVRK
ncbi:uncharacterized protein J4E78_008330 [Alternaria triticimaculans]|uniref:uncharacterized protein n=1 Tax=Alternaria triticimaculans TaxID=297637 RepID=UPI0020C245FA|nr:uncharacterized protein J4E78_008330 [Alternaria triticimaculans]KAI4650048.1 hypothetical protein J4E78_008330 [Alternaria triticimaculans]